METERDKQAGTVTNREGGRGKQRQTDRVQASRQTDRLSEWQADRQTDVHAVTETESGRDSNRQGHTECQNDRYRGREGERGKQRQIDRLTA